LQQPANRRQAHGIGRRQRFLDLAQG
jgi:hypothetical protein